MSNVIKLNVVGARKYSFNDRETGRLVEGVNVFYLNESDPTDDNSAGRVPAKVTLPYEHFEKIKNMSFPSTCNALLQQELTAKGVKTKVVGLQKA